MSEEQSDSTSKDHNGDDKGCSQSEETASPPSYAPDRNENCSRSDAVGPNNHDKGYAAIARPPPYAPTTDMNNDSIIHMTDQKGFPSAPPYGFAAGHSDIATGPNYNDNSYIPPAPEPPPPYEPSKEMPGETANETVTCLRRFGTVIGCGFLTFGFIMAISFIALLTLMPMGDSFEESRDKAAKVFMCFGLGMIATMIGCCVLVVSGKKRKFSTVRVMVVRSNND